jgi:hypothetical protein
MYDTCANLKPRVCSYHYEPVNQPVVYIPSAVPTPQPRQTVVAESSSLVVPQPSIPMAQFDVEHEAGSPNKPPMQHFRYGSFSSDTSSFNKAEFQSLKKSRVQPSPP